MKTITLLATALLAIAAPAVSEVLLEVRYWPADLGGRLQLESLENNEFFAGLDPIRDLGLEEDGVFEGRILARPSRRTVVRLAWLPLAFEGDATITGTVGGLTVSPRVRSRLDLDYGRLAVAWQPLSSRDGRFRLGPLVEAKGFRGEAVVSVDNPIVPIVRTTEFETGLPSAGLLLDLEPSPRVHVFAEVTTLVDTSEGDLRDAEAGVRVFVTEWLAVSAGYRLIEIDITDGADVLEVDLDALLAGVTLRF